MAISCTSTAVSPPRCRVIGASPWTHSSSTPPATCASKTIDTPELLPHQLRCACAPAASAARTCTTSSMAASAPCASRSRWCWATRWPASIEEVGSAVQGFAVGERIAISPSRPCGLCRYCQQGLQNHCLDMRYYGSAMRMPHVQGAFRQQHRRATPARPTSWPRHVSDGEGSMAEPLSVALHAVNRAGPLLGKSVLVTGCGPIGALVVIAARRAGATHIVVTDMAAQPLRAALKVGADRRSTSPNSPTRWRRFTADKGQFDVHLRGQRQCARAAQRLRCAAPARHPRAGGAGRRDRRCR